MVFVTIDAADGFIAKDPFCGWILGSEVCWWIED